MAARETVSESRDLGATARALVRSRDRAGLATSMKEDGWPYASLVMIACDAGANPLLMISELAEHTQNILAENRVGLLVDATEGRDNPLTGTRLTLMGRAAQTNDETHFKRYIARHPDAALYAEFTDFSLYRLDVERVHMVAGFGAIHWIEQSAYALDLTRASDLTAAEADIVNHMNNDHADSLQLYTDKLLGLSDTGWTMTGIDPEGLDLRNGATVARLSFDCPVGTAEEARAALVTLVDKARKIG